ncbi:putative cuticle-degrading protease [Rosellinia necatrix]|uniref:Putative cuticle-degrading protease n=1 Tax=Rosellinia necatrix TaxID=77044 RepID=A0A1S8A812_ROSNE|nr:putative cuticle-degrading protease [Rosellinia necatrix]
MRFSTLLALAPLVLAAPSKRAAPAPLVVPRDTGRNLVEGKYIVKLYDNAATESLQRTMTTTAAEADHVYDVPGFKGFASALTEAEIEELQNHPDVEFIEQDSIVSINAFVTQSSSTWGLARISHRSRTATGYVYDDTAGAGTCSYIVDTGIYTAHAEFEGRATFLANYADSSNTDGNGHGTHVAGTVGSKTYGVAKKTSLFAVKVLDSSGSGTTSGVVAGMNFVTSDSATRSCPSGAVANMSLGGASSTAINSAARAMISAGVFLAVAAGNSNTDAASTSPAGEAQVCTVGATTSADARASFSNYGTVVDVFAPGQDVLSTWNNGGTNTISGTSMASPHVAGLGAYLLAAEGARAPQALCAYIASIGTSGALSGVPSSTVNKLAFNNNPSG